MCFITLCISSEKPKQISFLCGQIPISFIFQTASFPNAKSEFPGAGQF